MAALNFVAADDGLEDDPKVQTLARLLKVSRPMAFWFVIRWQRLILQRGNHVMGSLPKNYTGDDIAAFLDFKGGARRLTDAMKKQGFLSFKKGRGFFYPGWSDTTTGRYASRREEDRLWHEQKRKEGRSSVARPSADVVRPSADTSSDGRTTSSRHPIVRKEETSAELPPDPPPPGGPSLADARWDWLLEHAPTPQDSGFCKRLLGPMSIDAWDLVRGAYNRPSQPGASISKKFLRVLAWPTDQFLKKEAYLRFRPRKRPDRRATTSSTPAGAMDTLAEIENRHLDGDAFLVGFLRDPDRPEAKKQEARERWLAEPANKGRQPPWTNTGAQQNGTPTPLSARKAPSPAVPT